LNPKKGFVVTWVPVENMEMRLTKHLSFFGIVILTVLACGLGDGISTALPVNQPQETWTGPTGVIPRQPRTATPPPVFLLSTPAAAATFPVWVAEFSNPILAALDGQRPAIHDDFVNFDQGWFYFIPDSPTGPFYAHIQDNGSLLLELPAENEKRDYWVYNPKLTRRNFVLIFDLQFEESQPEDTVRFQFDQTVNQSVAFDLSKNQTWALHWGSTADWQSQSGTYPYFSPEHLTLLIVVQGKECAFYINDTPFTYLDNCRTEAVARASPWTVTFHMLAEPGHIAAATIDNLKLWDLDKIPNLP
jgi:hypothetical protein